MRQLHKEELAQVSGGRGGGGAGGDRGPSTSSSNSNSNTNDNTGVTGSKNAGGGPGNSGPGDKNSPDLGGGGVGLLSADPIARPRSDILARGLVVLSLTSSTGAAPAVRQNANLILTTFCSKRC